MTLLVGLVSVLEDVSLARMAFNVTSVEGFEVLVEIAEELQIPCILQISERYLNDLGRSFVRDMVLPRLDRSTTRFVLHLDHAESLEGIVAGIKMGFTSVMYDGSRLDMATNIRNTRDVLRIARLASVSVEAEIGHVGGAEDGENGTLSVMTTPEEAETFVAEVSVDALAVAGGNAHGHYMRPPKLHLGRIREIHQRISVPLVLHGGTGIPMDDLLAAVQVGVKKINIGTELKHAWIVGAKEGMERSHELDVIRSSIKASIRRAILQFRPVMEGKM